VNHSSDNFVGNNVALLTFPAITAARVGHRVEATGTVNRYTRWVVAGTFTSITFQLAWGRR
jgi:hypothetical protein